MVFGKNNSGERQVLDVTRSKAMNYWSTKASCFRLTWFWESGRDDMINKARIDNMQFNCHKSPELQGMPLRAGMGNTKYEGR